MKKQSLQAAERILAVEDEAAEINHQEAANDFLLRLAIARMNRLPLRDGPDLDTPLLLTSRFADESFIDFNIEPYDHSNQLQTVRFSAHPGQNGHPLVCTEYRIFDDDNVERINRTSSEILACTMLVGLMRADNAKDYLIKTDAHLVALQEEEEDRSTPAGQRHVKSLTNYMLYRLNFRNSN